MGFNIKNNYGPNIEVNDGGKVTLVQGKDGLWHTADVEEAEYEEEVIVSEEPPMSSPFTPAVIDTTKAEAVIALLRQLMEGKTKPKDVLMPVRAAMDAGVIRRPTWEEFCQEFGSNRLKSKTSFSDYTNPDSKPYAGADFEMMKDKFRRLVTEGQ